MPGFTILIVLLLVHLLLPNVYAGVPSCAGSLTQIDSKYGELTVSATSPGSSRKCVFYLLEWAGLPISPPILRISQDCDPVIYIDNDVGLAFSFGTTYQFKYEEFEVSTSVETGTPLCRTTASSTTLLAPSCLNTNISITFPDNEYVSVSLINRRDYMLCRFYQTSPVSNVERYGACTDRFDFPAVGGDAFKVKVQIWAKGDYNDVDTCYSGTSLDVTVNGFTCSSVLDKTLLPGAVYAFSIASPAPTTGSCLLVSVNYSGTSVAFPCESSIMLTIGQLAAIFTSDTVVPGGTLNLKWTFTNGVFSCFSPTLSVTDLQAPVVFSVAALDGVSIRVSLDATPDTLLSGKACRASVQGCDGGLATPAPLTFTSCANAQYVDFNVQYKSNCLIAVEFFDSGNPATVLTTSDLKSVSVPVVPVWDATLPTVAMYGEGCILLSWLPPADLGGAPIVSYTVERKNGVGGLYIDAATGIEGQNYVACDFSAAVEYSFRITAFNREGGSTTTGALTGILIEYLLAAPASRYLVLPIPTVTAGVAMTVDIQLRNPDLNLDDDTAPNDRIFVGRLVNRGKLDDALTSIIPLLFGETGYTAASLPLVWGTAPAFSVVALPQGSGVYQVSDTVTVAGEYSLASYSLESGGLWGQYWSNPFLAESPNLERKDLEIDFAWDDIIFETSFGAYIGDVVSIRWTGFINAPNAEDYLFYLTSPDPVRLFINDVPVINEWATGCAAGCVSASIALTASYHHVRLEYKTLRGYYGYVRPTGVVFEWASPGIGRTVIPSSSLFKGSVIGGLLKSVTVEPSAFSAFATLVTLPTAPYSAGSAFIILVQTRDTYENSLLGDPGRTFTPTYTGGISGSLVVAFSGSGLYTITFTPNVAGLFSVSIEDSVVGTVLAGTFVEIEAAGSAHDLIGFTVTDDFPVDMDLVISFTVVDTFGNPIFETLPVITVTATWNVDDTAAVALLGKDESLLRSHRFGTSWTANFDTTPTFDFISSALSWHSGTSKFRVTLRLPHVGTYSVSIGVDGGAAATVLTGVTLLASRTYSASEALVVAGTGFPETEAEFLYPIAAAVGTPITATVQLRDMYMNNVLDPVALPTSVTIVLTTTTGETCNHNGSGSYSCSITPVLAGANLYVSILINGVQHASLIYLTTAGSVVKESRGPWLITVSEDTVLDSEKSTVTGIRSVYIVGVPVTAVITLRNALGVATGVDSGGTLSVTIGGNDVLTNTVANFGLITFDITATTPTAGSAELVVILDSNSLLVTTVTVLVGSVNVGHTTCESWTPTTVADVGGATITIEYAPLVCAPKDVGDNPITARDNLFAEGYCRNGASEPVYPGVLVGDDYSYTTEIFPIYGEFDCYFLLGQPGGLIAQYVVGGFLVGPDGTEVTVIEDQRYISEAPFKYTRIDSYLDFTWPDSIILPGLLPVEQINWSGVIVCPTAATYTFTVHGQGGVNVFIDDSSEISLIANLSVDATFVITSLAPFETHKILINYALATSGGAKHFSLKWSTSGDPMGGETPWTVPASAFQSPLEVFSSLTESMSVTNPSTFVIGNSQDPLLLEAGATYSFDIDLKTASGIDRTATEVECPSGTGTLSDCLFSFTTTEASVLDTAAVSGAANDGTYTVSISILSSYAGTASLFASLLLNGYSPKLNAGAPIAIRVRSLSVQSTWVLQNAGNTVINDNDTVAGGSGNTYTLTITGRNFAGTARAVNESVCPGSGDAISSYPTTCLFRVAYDGGALTSVSGTAGTNGVYTITFNFPDGPIAVSSFHVYLYDVSEELTGTTPKSIGIT